VIGSPIVDKATIQVPGGKPFTVIAEGNSSQNMYVQRLELNGKAYTRSWIHHNDLLKGGTLKFVMGSQPNKSFGAEEKDRPE
jgi:putative alpha-1,2-mannosidase